MFLVRLSRSARSINRASGRQLQRQKVRLTDVLEAYPEFGAACFSISVNVAHRRHDDLPYYFSRCA
jgi:hypothetical protein